MPPAHGPAVIDIILHSDELTAQWHVGACRYAKSNQRTAQNADQTRSLRPVFNVTSRLFNVRSGMFSFMGLTVEQVHRLRDEFAIYTVNSSRINVASFNEGNMDYFIDALAACTGRITNKARQGAAGWSVVIVLANV